VAAAESVVESAAESVVESVLRELCSGRICSAMTILVDDAIWPFRGERFAHLVSDESYNELHAFATRLGLPQRAFHGDHYDIPGRYRERAIELGAVPVDGRELVRRLRAAGLRRSARSAGAG
jgi:hypothetical protein